MGVQSKLQKSRDSPSRGKQKNENWGGLLYDKRRTAQAFVCFYFILFLVIPRKRRRRNAKLRTNNSRLILSILVDATKQIMDSLAHLRWRSSLLCSMCSTCTTCTSRKLLNVPPQLFRCSLLPSLFYLSLSLSSVRLYGVVPFFN